MARDELVEQRGDDGPASGERDPPCLGRMLLCHVEGQRVQGLHVQRQRGGVVATAASLAGPDGDRSDRPGRGCPVVLLLPRSAYLSRVLELPRVGPDETAAMLALEFEAILPQEFGDVEIAYRRLPAVRDGHDRFEACVARRADVDSRLALLAERGLRVDHVVPSALAWRGCFDGGCTADLLVACAADGTLEVASPSARGAVAVRAIGASTTGSGGMPAGLVEHLRSLLTERDESTLRVGWLGADCPEAASSGRVVFEDLSARMPAAEAAPLLRAGAAGLMRLTDAESLRTGNLLPRALVSARQRRGLAWQAGTAAACLVIACLLIWVALRVAAARCDGALDRLDRHAATIRTEGQVVGRWIDQLRAVEAARGSRHALHDVLAALLEVAPGDDVSFSLVQLNEEGAMVLRGQSRSASRPFDLFERLGRMPVFADVNMQGTAQVPRAGGTVNEFSFSCELARTGTR